MQTIFVMVKCELGRAYDVAVEAVEEIEQVSEVHSISGQYDLMMKCNLCYDRTSAGKKPMCATVCPSGALYYGTREDMRKMRPQSDPVNHFLFGKEAVTTKVNIMMPKGATMLKVHE